MEALLNMCCYQVFRWHVSLLLVFFHLRWIFNCHRFQWPFVNLLVVDLKKVVIRKRSKASYGHHRRKARRLLQSQPPSPLRNLCVWCCWPHCVTCKKKAMGWTGGNCLFTSLFSEDVRWYALIPWLSLDTNTLIILCWYALLPSKNVHQFYSAWGCKWTTNPQAGMPVTRRTAANITRKQGQPEVYRDELD